MNNSDVMVYNSRHHTGEEEKLKLIRGEQMKSVKKKI